MRWPLNRKLASMACCFRKVTHCIFDMDGLVLDTETLYTQVVQSILDKYDKKYSWEVKLSMMGMQTQDSSKKMVEIYDLPISPEEYQNTHLECAKAIMINAKPMPGVERLLNHLHANKIPFCLATSSGEDIVQIKRTNNQQVFSLFNHLVCGATDSDVKNGKPAPDIFLVAAKRFPDKPCPEKCLVFEDAPNGVKAACAACMQCVMVPDPRVPQKMRCQATAVLKSMDDFRPELFGLPPYPC